MKSYRAFNNFEAACQGGIEQMGIEFEVNGGVEERQKMLQRGIAAQSLYVVPTSGEGAAA